MGKLMKTLCLGSHSHDYEEFNGDSNGETNEKTLHRFSQS
jgi:hypothetical protein